MQTAVYDIAAKKVHEDPGAAEKYYRAQNQPAIEDRVDHVVLIEITPLVSGRSERRKQYQRHNRQQSQQVKQNRSAAKKVFLNFEPEDGANLPKPKRPGQWLLSDCFLRPNVYS